MSDWLTRAMACWVLLSVLPRSAIGAATVCGTLITNNVTITCWAGSPSFVSYEMSYNATCEVMVLCPAVVALRKFVLPANIGSGGTLTYQVSVENQQLDTVWNVTITDLLPVNTMFLDWQFQDYDLTSPNLGAPVPTQSSALAGPWSGAAPVGQGAPYYLRWVLPGIGPVHSACVTYRARIL